MQSTDRITFLGDVCITEPLTCRAPWESIVVLNLEGPLGGKPTADKRFCLSNNWAYVVDAVGATPGAVCLANNHTFDAGESGFDNTIQSLQTYGVPAFGWTQKGKRTRTTLSCGGKKVALLGYACSSTGACLSTASCQGVSEAEIGAIETDIGQARREGADCVVVSLHWGAEHISLPKPKDVELAHATIDAGANLIIGHHSHRIQCAERYNGKYIFYGLGNYAFRTNSCTDRQTFRSSRLGFARMNRRSLAVTYNPMDDSVAIHLCYLSGNSMLRKRLDSESVLKQVPRNQRKYAQIFARTYYREKLWYALLTWFHSPRWPHLRHVKSLLGILCDPAQR